MGFVNFRKKSDLNETEKWALESIRRRLKKKGFKMIDLDNWEVHGPHEKMNYQVWIGAVKYIKKRIYLGLSNRNEFYVAIYPKKIYVINDPSDSWKTDEVI